jgi:hypothetical protein
MTMTRHKNKTRVIFMALFVFKRLQRLLQVGIMVG